MKKFFFSICFIFFSFTSLVFSQQLNVQLDLDLKTISLMSDSDFNKLVDEQVIVALDGLLSSVIHRTTSEGKNQIVLSIINGKWQGTEKIEVFQCDVILDDPKWQEFFPERMPRTPGDEIIQVNSYLLILGPLEGIEYRNGQKIILINGSKLRKIS